VLTALYSLPSLGRAYTVAIPWRQPRRAGTWQTNVTMDLRTLRYFVAVLQAGSLSRAAHSLYIAQPALTAQIKKLEADLGVQLLERSHVGVTATPAGTQLYEDAQRLLSDAEAMRERIQRLPQGPEGSVTVAVPFLLASLLLGPVIARLHQTHPRVRVFVLDDLSVMVKKAMLDKRADLGVLVNTPALSDLAVMPLAQEHIHLCGWDLEGALAKHSNDACSMLDFAAAAALPLVLQSRRFFMRQAVQEVADARNIRLNIVHEHDSARVLYSLCRCGAGFMFKPASALVEPSPWHEPLALPRHDPRWVVPVVTNPSLQRSYFIAQQPHRRDDPATAAVRAALLAQTHAIIAQGVWQARWVYPDELA